MNPTCSFCKQPIEDGPVMVNRKAIIKIHGDHFELTDSDKMGTLSHENCWEGRNKPFPVRRRVISFGVPE